MFSCTLCSERYTLEDIKQGNYFVTTSTCLSCYKKMYRSKVRCFGKKEMYDPKVIACQECPDAKICRTFTYHRKEFQ